MKIHLSPPEACDADAGRKPLGRGRSQMIAMLGGRKTPNRANCGPISASPGGYVRTVKPRSDPVDEGSRSGIWSFFDSQQTGQPPSPSPGANGSPDPLPSASSTTAATVPSMPTYACAWNGVNSNATIISAAKSGRKKLCLPEAAASIATRFRRRREARCPNLAKSNRASLSNQLAVTVSNIGVDWLHRCRCARRVKLVLG